MDKTHVTINVAGQELRLSADDSEAYIRKIAGYVNDKVDEVQRSYPNLSTANCLNMDAVNPSDELPNLPRDFDALGCSILQPQQTAQHHTPSKPPLHSQTTHSGNH